MYIDKAILSGASKSHGKGRECILTRPYCLGSAGQGKGRECILTRPYCLGPASLKVRVESVY